MKIKPCLGCGYCCKKAMCALGVQVYGKIERLCPFLVFNGSIYRCKLVELGYDIGQGMGCSSTLFNTERNKYDSKLSKK